MSVWWSPCGEWTRGDPEGREISWEAIVSAGSKEMAVRMERRIKLQMWRRKITDVKVWVRGTAIHQDGQTRRAGLGGNSILDMLNWGTYRTSEQTFPAHVWTFECGTQERNLGWENSRKLSVCTWWVKSWERIGSHKESTPQEEGGFFFLSLMKQ